MANKFNVHDVVKYRLNWCTPEERHIRLLVLEVRDYSNDRHLHRIDYLLGTILTEEEKTRHPFGLTEVVSEDMIQLATEEVH